MVLISTNIKIRFITVLIAGYCLELKACVVCFLDQIL